MAGLILGALLALTVADGAQQSPPPPPPAVVARQDDAPVQIEDVVVSGRSMQDQARTFVGKVSAPPPGMALARWHRSVCIGVANLQPEYAQQIIDRVSAVALSLDLVIGQPGCKANVMIVASDQASAFTQRMVSDEPFNFRPARSMTDLGGTALRAFENSTAPGRWWHVAMPVNVDTGDRAVRLHGETDPPVVAVRGASLLVGSTRNDLSHVVIVVDVHQVRGISIDVLSDYIAMVAMAQIDPEVDLSGQSSILNLFSNSERVSHMTDWDVAYLRALYSARQDRAVVTHQTREIANTMVEGIGAASEAPAPHP